MRSEDTDESERTSVHPHHDALVDELRRWFTSSAPEINYVVTEQWYGYLSNPDGPTGTRLILTLDDPTLVAPALRDARNAHPDQEITIWVDDRRRFHTLDSVLRRAGCRTVKATTHLALVGPMRAVRGPVGLQFDDVAHTNLHEWAETKIRCFENSDVAPDAQRLAREISVRDSELALATLKLVRLDGEPVGVLGYYAGFDQLLFNVGTRVGFRHRGIAQSMLAYWVDEGTANSSRSLMINADDPGQPAALYRHLGFRDEIYWYQSYQLAANTATPAISMKIGVGKPMTFS
jgi:hypothetical protein